MKRASGLRSSSSTSGPPAASRSRMADAAGRASTTGPSFSSSPGPGRSTSTRFTLPSAGNLSAVSEATATQQWICESCGFIYDPEEGDPDGGVPAGTAFEDIPGDWVCPVCGARKKDFSPYEG